MGRKKTDPIERFFSKIKITDDCWLWQGGLDNDGYGLFGFEGKQWRAHRYSQHISNGLDNNKPVVMHTCDNPSCVNPAHLVNGTIQENNLDKVNKGRHRHTFTDAQVLYIRASTKSIKELADEFNVIYNVIWYCRHRVTYKHLP